MNILGLYGAINWDGNVSFDIHNEKSWVHDSGVTLFIDGKHISSISEERLTRQKFEGNFPIHSIQYCLSEGNISREDVDEIYMPSMCLTKFYHKVRSGSVESILKRIFPNAKLHIVSHHLSHAASSIFTSDFQEGCFITLDGAGSVFFNCRDEFIDVETSTIGYFNKKRNIFRMFPGINGKHSNNFGTYYVNRANQVYNKKTKKHSDPNCGYHRESVSGKIMGLSAYGKTKLSESVKEYGISTTDGYPYVSLGGDVVCELLSADEEAYVVQNNFENALVDYFNELNRLNFLEENICLAGGSFLNVLGNSRLKKLGYNIHVPPCTSDTGLHFGAACYGVYKSKQKISLPKNIALLGKEYSEEEITTQLDKFNLEYERYENFEDVCEITSQKLNENKIIGWFQGRSEFGPRSLGSRSILMHPGPSSNKDIMNSRVKHREEWRPFAGIILEEYLSEYFEEDFCSPYMLYSLTVREEKRDKIGAITHIDNTCRIQTSNRELYPEVTTLIQKFNEISSIPVVLNTSFNDNGEPIVESPEDAIKAFNNLDIDYLVIGNFIVEK